MGMRKRSGTHGSSGEKRMDSYSSDKHYWTKDFVRKKLTKMKARDVNWSKASEPTFDYKYNCFGFAVGDLRWWQKPKYLAGRNMHPYAHWPEHLPQNWSIGAYVAAAESFGYRV